MSNHERGPETNPGRPSRDEALVHAWRGASAEEPPAQLDAAILAEARQSIPDRRVESATTSEAAPAVRERGQSRFRRWQPLAAAASVAGLAFVLVQTLPREHDLLPTKQSQESVSIPASLPPPQPTMPLESHAVPAPAAKEVARQEEQTEARDLAPAQRAVAPPLLDAAAPPPVEPSAATPVAEAAPSSNGTAAATDMAAATAPVREKSASNGMQRLDATDWAASIEAQYAAGDVAGAADRLRAFRAIDPDADQYLPDTLRAWARSVE